LVSYTGYLLESRLMSASKGSVLRLPANLMMNHFDEWAATYDNELQAEWAKFPFAGYETVLATIVNLVLKSGATRMLDLGMGTGTIASQVMEARPGIDVWGIDFSEQMLARAKKKAPRAHLIQADLDQDLIQLVLPSFNAIVASYVLHELPDEKKAAIIVHLLEHRLESRGLLAIGDIAFASATQLSDIRQAEVERWDDDEHYFIADEFLQYMRKQGIEGDYVQLSVCAGVFTFNNR